MMHTWLQKLQQGAKWWALGSHWQIGQCKQCLCVCLSVCLPVWVYSGHIIHHYNGIWGTCAPGRRNMHHSGAMCTTVHKRDYVFWKIHYAPLQWYMGALFTIRPQYAPPSRNVHHGAQGRLYFLKNSGFPVDRCLSVCLSVFTQATLCTTTMVNLHF